jgi:glycerol-3-phosphate dehydrogenase subunit C
MANWATRSSNKLTRPVMEMAAGIDRHAALPEYAARPFTDAAKAAPPPVNRQAPAFGRKAVLYATCFANYNNTAIADAALKVLALNGVETEVVYPRCCGMPQLEHGDIAQVAKNAEKTAAELKGWIEKGYHVIGLVPSCVLMFKFEWPLILPENEDVERLSAATFDIAEYMVRLAGKEGLAPGLKPLEGGVTVHISCHSRAQNMGQKATELLKLLPYTRIMAVERCSGHGGSWGVMKDNFEVAMKIGKPVARQAVKNGSAFVVSECPLAREHVLQGMGRLDVDVAAIGHAQHPIQLLALAYGI